MKKTVDTDDLLKVFTPARVWYCIVCALVCCILIVGNAPIASIKLTVLVFAAIWAFCKFLCYSAL